MKNTCKPLIFVLFLSVLQHFRTLVLSKKLLCNVSKKHLIKNRIICVKGKKTFPMKLQESGVIKNGNEFNTIF